MYYVNRPYGLPNGKSRLRTALHGTYVCANTDDRRTDSRRPRPWCIRVLRTFTHAPHPTGWHARRRFGLCRRRTGSSVLRCRSQAAGGSHGGRLGGRSEIATDNPEATLFARSGHCHCH